MRCPNGEKPLRNLKNLIHFLHDHPLHQCQEGQEIRERLHVHEVLHRGGAQRVPQRDEGEGGAA